MNLLIKTVLENKQYFKECVEYRCNTSPNKDHHQAVIDAIDANDDSLLIELVMAPKYKKQLSGVILCAFDHKLSSARIKHDLITGFEQVYNTIYCY